MKIDKGVSVPGRSGGAWPDFVEACKTMNLGDSIFLPSFPSHYRIAISIAPSWLNRQFMTRKDGAGVRVWRVT